MSTFIELKEQAQQEIRAHIGLRLRTPTTTSLWTTRTTSFDRGAALLAALRVWAEPRQKTDADILALIDSATATTLVNIARGLAQSHSPEELHASVQLEGIAYASPRQLYDALDFARKGLH